MSKKPIETPSDDEPPFVYETSKLEAKAEAPKAKPALTAAELVQIGLEAADKGVQDSPAARAARVSVLESVAAMMLAAK